MLALCPDLMVASNSLLSTTTFTTDPVVNLAVDCNHIYYWTVVNEVAINFDFDTRSAGENMAVELVRQRKSHVMMPVVTKTIESVL